uniref:Csm2 n=1 Tax=Thermococcus onnurineus (strain NA1) TaxID=523850 RepID=UPI00118EA3F1|nr:Chain B, Csm2 [Thermococcus onnurineus NA1]
GSVAYHQKHGGYGRGGYGRQDRPQVDASRLFGESPDVVGIKKMLEGKGKQWEAIQPYFDNVVREAKNFLEWSPNKRLANAVTVAAYLTSQGLKTNQVRKILDMARTTELKVKRGEGDIKDDLVKMRYLLAYTVGKATGQSKYSLDAFHRILDPMLEVLMGSPKKENFEKFYDFLQAVVAYHKFFGGGD